ncbi:DUF6731 family protein [Nonomuraea africana]|uniref:DUF6731 family protein n=1 Tax=Nonomuraea africana TaxID=46171 RepID=UPI0033F1EC7A
MSPQSRRTTARSQSPATVERNIYFYRIDAGADESGVPRNVDMELAAAFKAIEDLPFESDSARYMTQADGNALCAWVDDVSEVTRIRLGSIRKNGLPQSEFGGRLRNLSLEDNEGICEMSHICVFASGIVGVEHNYYGPRATRLPSYVQYALSGSVTPFTLEALLRHNVASQLQGRKSIRKLTMRVRRSYIAAISEANESLGKALEAAATGSGAATVGIVLQPEPYKRTNLKPELTDFLRKIISREDLHEQTEELRAAIVDDATGKVDEINLLADHLISKRSILRLAARSRVLDSRDAYRTIVEAYRDIYEDLLSASSASLSSEG